MANQIKKKFIEDVIFSDISLEITDAVAIEEGRASAEEARIEGKVDGETTRASAEEARIEGLVADEVTRASDEEARIEAKVDNIISNTDPAALDSLTEIVTAFQNADTDLNQAITDLSGAASTDRAAIRQEFADEDAALQSQIDSNDGDITALQNEDVTLQGNIDAEAQTRQQEDDQIRQDVAEGFGSLKDDNTGDYDANNRGNLHQEFSALEAADDDLQNQIDGLSSGSISNLQSELDATQAGAGLGIDGSYSSAGGNYIAAATSLANADDLLDAQVKINEDAIADEIIAREAAVATEASNRATAVQDEEDRAIAAEQALGIRIDNVLANTDEVALNSLAEIVTEFQNADSSLNGAITSLSDAASTDRAAIRQEFAAADTTLQGNIDVVSGDLATEISDREAADTTLQGNIDVVSGDLATEISDREAADDAIKGDISDAVYTTIEGLDDALAQEVSDRETAVQGVQDQLDALDANYATDQEVSEAVAAEETRATGAEGALSGRLDLLEAVVWSNEKFELTQADIDNGFISLAQSPVSGSVSAFVGRLAIHEGAADDYEVSGSQVTFLNDLIGMGNQKLQAGDVVYVKYQYES